LNGSFSAVLLEGHQLEVTGTDDRLQHRRQFPKPSPIGFEADRHLPRWSAVELESQEASRQHGTADANVPTQLALVAFDVDTPPMSFELALKQEIRRLAISPLWARIKRYLEVLIPTTRDRYVR
jgi:hypothetical protein